MKTEHIKASKSGEVEQSAQSRARCARVVLGQETATTRNSVEPLAAQYVGPAQAYTNRRASVVHALPDRTSRLTYGEIYGRGGACGRKTNTRGRCSKSRPRYIHVMAVFGGRPTAKHFVDEKC